MSAVRPVSVALTGSRPSAPSSATTGLIEPKPVVVPYSNVYAVCCAFGLTWPVSVASVFVIDVADRVTAVGACAVPVVRKLRTTPALVPAELTATTR